MESVCEESDDLATESTGKNGHVEEDPHGNERTNQPELFGGSAFGKEARSLFLQIVGSDFAEEKYLCLT